MIWLFSNGLKSECVAIGDAMLPAVGFGEIDELFVLAGVGLKDEIGDGCGFGIVGKFSEKTLIGGKAVVGTVVLWKEGVMGLADEGFEVEPVPTGVDIRKIGNDEVKGAVFIGADV